MPRDLPLGNGGLLVNFDKSYNLRDIYWPHVGQDLHTAGDISHTGIWIEGQFAWLDSSEWQREMLYDEETLVTHVTLKHSRLQIELVFRDIVDFNRPIFLRHAVITNRADHAREVRLLRTQIDNDGAIIASDDADVREFSRDSYSYMWPRDGALVANALSHAGYSEITRAFYDFCNAVLTESGYLLHKYNPDRSW